MIIAQSGHSENGLDFHMPLVFENLCLRSNYVFSTVHVMFTMICQAACFLQSCPVQNKIQLTVPMDSEVVQNVKLYFFLLLIFLSTNAGQCTVSEKKGTVFKTFLITVLVILNGIQWKLLIQPYTSIVLVDLNDLLSICQATAAFLVARHQNTTSNLTVPMAYST